MWISVRDPLLNLMMIYAYSKFVFFFSLHVIIFDRVKVAAHQVILDPRTLCG